MANGAKGSGNEAHGDERRVRTLVRLIEEQGPVYAARLFVQAFGRVTFDSRERAVATALSTALNSVIKAVQ